MSRSTSEQRREARKPADAKVSLLLDGPEPIEIAGRLLDVSQHGFRAAHHMSTLCAGDEVYFRHSNIPGKARVVWNRILQGHVESGFLILEQG